ncbi:hypothetical protein [Roseobacter sp. MH60115]|uniref:hypothetical protein n=1 Tax=Roseobacter sp. MH60115 TaxID=2785324 RepID=UPI0018A2C2AD|nr:hypothetical protein [Roseobacter sp. MH60115]
MGQLDRAAPFRSSAGKIHASSWVAGVNHRIRRQNALYGHQYTWTSPAASGQQEHWDKAISGFGVLCPAKTKSFFVAYERDRRLRRIGKYSKIMPREAHLEARRRYCQTRKKRLKSTKAAVSAHPEDIRARFTRMHFETTGGTS